MTDLLRDAMTSRTTGFSVGDGWCCGCSDPVKNKEPVVWVGLAKYHAACAPRSKQADCPEVGYHALLKPGQSCDFCSHSVKDGA